MTDYTGLVVWRQLGDLVSATTALGLHRQSPGRPVTFVSEVKKRLFSCIYIADMGSSLLTGRPPSLSSRFSRIHIPVDVSDEALMQGGEVLQRAMEDVDANGWNLGKKHYANTSTRSRIMMAPILNEALELFLGDPEELEGAGETIKYAFPVPTMNGKHTDL